MRFEGHNEASLVRNENIAVSAEAHVEVSALALGVQPQQFGL